MAANNTADPATLANRKLAMRIIYYGFDDTDLATVIATGTTNGYVDGPAYDTQTPELGI